MAIGFYFTPENFSKEKYDECIRLLEAAGAGAPRGRSYHVALETEGGVNVFDVWDSMEEFEAFGQTLLPILASIGIDPGQPMVQAAHNIIEG